MKSYTSTSTARFLYLFGLGVEGVGLGLGLEGVGLGIGGELEELEKGEGGKEERGREV